MCRLLRELLDPMSLAGLVTIVAVALSFGFGASAHELPRWLLLGTFAAIFVGHDLLSRPWLRHAALLAQAACALALVWLEPRAGTAPILLVVVMAKVVTRWPRWAVLTLALALNAGLYTALARSGYERTWLIVTIYTSFEAFAALSAHYAASANRARDALARVNADLLATRALLA
ncbi:MAG: hypothetical protein QM581_10900, partial [Pseudomonas sp.]